MATQTTIAIEHTDDYEDSVQPEDVANFFIESLGSELTGKFEMTVTVKMDGEDTYVSETTSEEF